MEEQDLEATSDDIDCEEYKEEWRNVSFQLVMEFSFYFF